MHSNNGSARFTHADPPRCARAWCALPHRRGAVGREDPGDCAALGVVCGALGHNSRAEGCGRTVDPAAALAATMTGAARENRAAAPRPYPACRLGVAAQLARRKLARRAARRTRESLERLGWGPLDRVPAHRQRRYRRARPHTTNPSRGSRPVAVDRVDLEGFAVPRIGVFVRPLEPAHVLRHGPALAPQQTRSASASSPATLSTGDALLRKLPAVVASCAHFRRDNSHSPREGRSTQLHHAPLPINAHSDTQGHWNGGCELLGSWS